MANIISVLHPDGQTALSTEIRAGVEQPVVETNLVYNENGGEGMAELMLRNVSSNNNALNVQVTTSEDPIDNQSGNTLSQQWDYKILGSDTWRNVWQDTIEIPRIPPGQFIHVRTRVIASAEADPTTHEGGILVTYLRSSV